MKAFPRTLKGASGEWLRSVPESPDAECAEVWQQGHGVRSQSGGSDENLSPACCRPLQSLSFALGGGTAVTTLGQGGEATYLFIFFFLSLTVDFDPVQQQTPRPGHFRRIILFV